MGLKGYLGFMAPLSEPSAHSIELVAPLVYLATVLLGVAFYCAVNGWSLDIGFYFATQVVLGQMYDTPQENDWSRVFTLAYFIWGTSLLAAAIGAMANQIISRTLRNITEERKKALDALQSPDGSPVAEASSRWSSFLLSIGWYDHSSRYIGIGCMLTWCALGVAYGVVANEWTVAHSLYCTASSLCANGMCAPACAGTDALAACDTPLLLLALYITVGVPLFAFSMAQVVGIAIEKYVRASELRMLKSPLSSSEFEYAMELSRGTHSPSAPRERVIDLGGFIVMELLRLRKVDLCDLDLIRRLFAEVDVDCNGVIDLDELQRHALLPSARGEDAHSEDSHRSAHGSEAASVGQEDDSAAVEAYNRTLVPLMNHLHAEAREQLQRRNSSRETRIERSQTMGAPAFVEKCKQDHGRWRRSFSSSELPSGSKAESVPLLAGRAAGNSNIPGLRASRRADSVV